MKVELVYGRTYRAQVAIPALAKGLIGADMLRRELERYQLYGVVADTGPGFEIEATFRGRTGTYTLPDAVQTVEVVR